MSDDNKAAAEEPKVEETPKEESPKEEAAKEEGEKKEEEKEAPKEEAKAEAKEEDKEKEGEGEKEEDDCHVEGLTGESMLQAVESETGEENDEAQWTCRAKLFRFDKEENAWKERGTGDAKLLKDKDTGKVRFLMRRDGTKKICANHSVYKEMELKPMAGSDRAWVWVAIGDLADGSPSDDTLAIRVKNAEAAKEFADALTKVKDAL